MGTRYIAYGLRLDCDFALPGMRALEHSEIEAWGELPRLELRLCNSGQLEDAWSGGDGRPEWRGRLGDGRDLVLERGSAGDLLFTYGELARFHLHPGMERLDCAPRRPSLDWQRTLIGKVLPAISVMRGYEGLHAAVVDSPDGVVGILAASGGGKSTLALELLRRGWSLFADDVLVLGRDDERVLAYPGTPHMSAAENPPNGVDPRSLGITLGRLAGECWVSVHASATEPRPVHALCSLERGEGHDLSAHALPPSPLQLAPHILGLSTDACRQRMRFELYADLTESALLVRLTSGLHHSPEELADVLLQTLSAAPEPATMVR